MPPDGLVLKKGSSGELSLGICDLDLVLLWMDALVDIYLIHHFKPKGTCLLDLLGPHCRFGMKLVSSESVDGPIASHRLCPGEEIRVQDPGSTKKEKDRTAPCRRETARRTAKPDLDGEMLWRRTLYIGLQVHRT